MRTAERLVQAVRAGEWPSPGACVDYGITGDRAAQIYCLYRIAVVARGVTAEQLDELLMMPGSYGETPGEALGYLLRIKTGQWVTIRTPYDEEEDDS